MRLTIVIFTYTPELDGPRAQYAVTTLRSTLEHARFDGDEVSVHIADDGSPAGHVDALRDIAFGAGIESVSSTNAQRSGYGASYNLASQVTHLGSGPGDVILCLEDDWQLMRPLDLTPLAEDLMDGPPIECIRLGYIGYTDTLKGEIRQARNQKYLLFDPDSPERHVFAGHPRLETVAYQRRVGPWPEGLNAGATEFVVAGRAEARRGVGWPLDLGMSASQSGLTLYAHIGSIQAREDQRAG